MERRNERRGKALERTQAFPKTSRSMRAAAHDDDDSATVHRPDPPLNQFHPHQSAVVRHHGVGFPSSEEESMAEMGEVGNDYDDEESLTGHHMPAASSRRANPSPIAARKSAPVPTLPAAPLSTVSTNQDSDTQSHQAESKNPPPNKDDPSFHEPRALPRFRDPKLCSWTSSHAANCPSEDRSCSLVNLLLRPKISLPSGEQVDDKAALIRLSLWSVIDGHGGGSVATYTSEVLLPHLAASVSRAINCTIVDRGVCTVNGELRDANALDLDGLIRVSDRSRYNPNSIHYRSPSPSNEEGRRDNGTQEGEEEEKSSKQADSDRSAPPSIHPEASVASVASPRLLTLQPQPSHEATSVSSVKSSVKTSVKTSSSHRTADIPVGTHSAAEVANITKAITNSFLAVDEGWINSIDPVATHQTSCQSNGRWNAGACALVVFTIQRLEWTSTSAHDLHAGVCDQHPRDDTSHNRDAARRRMLDYASKRKQATSTSSMSSTSSMLTEDDPNNLSAFESEITETEDDGEESDFVKPNRKQKSRPPPHHVAVKDIHHRVIPTPGGCDCHVYRPHQAMVYTAHVGDCRAVLLGSAPPRTIKVGPVGGDSSAEHPDTTDDESSYHSSDETECLSSSDHEAESSDEETNYERKLVATTTTPPYLQYMRRPARRQSRRSRRDAVGHAPFVALPPLPISQPSSSGSEEDSDSDAETLFPKTATAISGEESDENSCVSLHGRDTSPPLELAPFTRPIDLTTDHSAYNPAEVSGVLRRCNNAPRAISAGVGGGIKRVAGSLAVTRALGDAYLKTPLLSFTPYKDHAPYITARPEVNCRLVTKDGDRAVVLATDGVWERCSGDDVLRWVRNYSAERMAEAERRKNRRSAKRGVSSSTTADNVDVGQKRDLEVPAVGGVGSGANKKRKVVPQVVRRHGARNESGGPSAVSTVADVIVRRVLNKVRRARNISSLQALMSLPKGRARRAKHDDITASVIDLSAFVS